MTDKTLDMPERRSKPIDEPWTWDEAVELSRLLFDRGEQVASIAILDLARQARIAAPLADKARELLRRYDELPIDAHDRPESWQRLDAMRAFLQQLSESK